MIGNNNISHVMTLANGIIGVSVLAMPYCFKQCGIVLATLVLLVSSVLSRLACHFLIKSAVMSRRRNFEFLAFHAFGSTGKFFVELFIIGFLVGTCIAFFVVVGDLGPQIVGKILDKKPEDIRTSILVTTGTFIVFPLGLLRNIDSLSSVCTATIGFYFCLVVKVIAESTRHIFLGDWYDRVMYWRPAGILQCLPIFAMALFCQTQLFEIYQAIPNVCLEKMNHVVRGALNICTCVYLCVGFFGYVAFCAQPFTGNILMSFEPSLSSDLIKIGFVLSVAFSFPLVIFPCRASLNSLLFRRSHTHELSNYYIPEMRFRCLTLTIVAMSLGTGILIPNIEFVLGIVGSTIGVMICLIFPAAFFIAISTKNTNERLIAQAILFFGMWIMVLGTYANIYAMEESSSSRLIISTGKPFVRINDVITSNNIPIIQQLTGKDVKINQQQSNSIAQQQESLNKQQDSNKKDDNIEIRREPPIPVERSSITEKSNIDDPLRPLGKDNIVENIIIKSLDDDDNQKNKKQNSEQESVVAATPSVIDQQLKLDKIDDKNGQDRNENLINLDAIKKEESELADVGDVPDDIKVEARHEKLRQTLEKHKLEQLEMMQEQKKLLKDIKEQKQQLEMEKKHLAEEQRKKNNDPDNIRDDKRIIDKIDENFLSNTSEDKKRKKIYEKKSSIIETDSNNNPLENTVNNDNNNDVPLLSSIVVESNKSRGPIINALTNWTSKRNVPALVSSLNESTRDVTINEKLQKKISLEFALPIALKMTNQTKDSKTIDRDKREIIENLSNRDDTKIVNLSEKIDIDSSIDRISTKQCAQKDVKSLNSLISIDETTTVKTKQSTSINILSASPNYIDIAKNRDTTKQLLTDEILSNVNLPTIIDGNLQKSNKRDLKALSPGQ